MNRLDLPLLAFVAIGLGLSACAGKVPKGESSPAAASVAAKANAPVPVEVAGIHNAYWLGPQVLSGSQPEGPEAFEALAKLGIKTLVSVDGAAPDAEEAARHGIRTVHLPVGYDGIPRERQLELLRVARDLPGPFFVHCHHGKHRGPTGAAIIAMGQEGWTPAEAVAAMKAAGTGAEYADLYQCVADFAPPTAADIENADGSFPSRSKVDDLAEMMVHADERWESLKLAKAAGWKTPPGHSDIDPPHEALMLKEAFRELARTDSTLPAAFVSEAGKLEKAAADLESALRANNATGADLAFAAGAASCKSCHVSFRNVTGALGNTP